MTGLEKLKVGIIGCGAISGVHADAIMSSENAVLTAVADIDQDVCKEAAQRYGCTGYTDYYDMIRSEAIDAVHICTPHYLHVPMAIQALKAGKHVMVEKPIAIGVEEAGELIEVAKAAGKHLGVAFQNRYNNTSKQAKALLEKKALGEIKGIKGLVTWYRDEAYYKDSSWRGRHDTEGGGVLINQAIHTLDLMQWFGGEMLAIKGNIDTRMLDTVIEVEDTADATVYYDKGAVGIFYATNCFTTNSSVEIEIHCEKGMLTIKDGELTKVCDGKKEMVVDDHHDGKYKSYWGDSHKKLIESFYKGIITDDETYYVTGEQSICALEMIKGIYASAKTGKKYYF